MVDAFVLALMDSRFGGRHTLGRLCHCRPPGCTCVACPRGHRHIERTP